MVNESEPKLVTVEAARLLHDLQKQAMESVTGVLELKSNTFGAVAIAVDMGTMGTKVLVSFELNGVEYSTKADFPSGGSTRASLFNACIESIKNAVSSEVVKAIVNSGDDLIRYVEKAVR